MSLTLAINQNLHLITLFLIVILAGILVHRVIRIFCNALISAIIAIQYPSYTSDSLKSALQKYAHHSLIGHSVAFLALIVNASIHLIVTALRAFLMVLYILLPVVILSLIMVIINEKWSEFLLFIVSSFNTTVGDTLKTIIMFPLDMFEMIASNALPVVNLVIYTIFQIPIQLFYHIAIGDGKTHLVSFVKGVANSFPLFTASAQRFVINNTKSCKSHMMEISQNNGTTIRETNYEGVLSYFICTNSSMEYPGKEVCSPIPAQLEAFSCFDFEKREIDLYSGFMQWQQASGHAIMTLGTSCEAIALIANITLFPLADPIFWKSLDRFGNGILSALVVAPTSAIQRCTLAGGFLQRPAMCTPDFGPAFDFFAAGSLLLGQALTHWIDIVYLLLIDTSSSNPKDIIFGTCDQSQDYKALFSQDEIRSRVMGSNVTVLVRMTPTTFALTDGYSAIFVEQDGPLRRSYVPGFWLNPINPKYGISRVIMPSGSSVNDNGIGLFGCSCTTSITIPNNNSSIQLQCSIATKNGNSWILPVEWSLSSETQLLTCSRLRIVVQSLRWPEKRVVTSELNGYTKSNIDLDCTFGENCLVGDVAIYAIPICGSQDGVKAMACFPEKYFTRGICFPYCMALHMRNEMTRPIVMRGAMEWEQGVIIAQRDCSPFHTVQPVQQQQQQQQQQVINDDEQDMETICTVQSKQAIQDVSYNRVLSTARSATDTTSIDQFKHCSFRSTCITRIRNKTLIPDYASAVNIGKVPIIQTEYSGLDSGSRLILYLQPLVVAGGVQLRRYKTDNLEDIVDFPTLVGNQRNEFTMESFSYVGIPVAPPASVPSEEDVHANAEPGKIFLPQSLSYVQVHIPTSPATLSTDALWYATNPSYEFLYAMINYCSTKGSFSQTQIMILSSYSPMRIWRVRYKTSGCYLSGPDMIRICSSDVVKSFAMSDPAYDIPKFKSETLKNSSTLMDMCTSNVLLNLWVESLETFDEYNILIIIRRGRFQDMGYLLDDMERLKNNGDMPIPIKMGSSVFYFMSRFDFKIRQDYPWKMTDYLRFVNLSSPSTSLFDTTCPQLRVVPDIGRFVGSSLTAVVHLMKTPINFLLNPFAIQEVLLARAYQRCPENSLMHSTLDNCGMNLFSFSNYFESMYAANEAFWEFTSWIVLKVTGSLTHGFEGTAFEKEVQIFNQFLRGAIVLGDSSKLISMFDVTRTMEFLDIGVEEVIFKTQGRRRHLLNTEDGDETNKGGSLTSIFSHLTGFAKGGLGSLFSITKSVSAGVAGNLFSGADLGSLMASQNPMASIIGTSLSMPVLAWAQVTYESLLPITLDILANAQNRMFTLKPIWVHMYDTLDLYDHIIHERHKQACLGYRLMIGYTSSLGAAVYYNCLAAAEMPRGVWTVALTVFVDANLYRCLCVNPAGQEYLAYTYKNCEYLMSSNRKGLWQNILSTQSIHQVCQQYSLDIEKQLYAAFDSWTTYGFQASDAMTSVLDEFFVHRSHMFDCNSVNSNPTAIVLTPLPIHHFHVCGKTTSCRLKCEESIMVFEAEYTRVKNSGSIENLRKQTSYTHDIESPFFNKYSGNWGESSSSTSLLQNRNNYIRAIKTQQVSKLIHEDSPCKLRCSLKATTKDTLSSVKCITVLTEHIDISTNTYEISFYCIPSAGSILASVFNTGIQNEHALLGLDNIRHQEGMKITHIEFSIQNTTAYSASTFTIVYGTKETSTWSLNSVVALNEYNDITLWKTKPFYSPADTAENAQRSNIINSIDIASTIIDDSMKLALFGSNLDVFQPQVSSCKIMSVVEIFSGIPNKFTFFFSTRVQVQALLQEKGSTTTSSESNTQSEFRQTYMLYGVVHHCDYDNNNALQHSICMNSINYYVPCNLCRELERDESECSCKPEIDQVLQMAEQGSFLHSSGTMYFFLPTNNNRLSYGEDGKLDPDWLGSLGNEKDFSLKGMKVEIDPHNGIIKNNRIALYKFDENIPTTIDALGSWSRLDVFSTSLINTKPVRDVTLHGDSITPLYFFQVDGSEGKTSIASDWLQQSRITSGTKSWVIKGFKSATTKQPSFLIINCNISSCFGCGTSKLRLLCHAAQDCALSKCIGTMVQTRNVFCSVGNVFEKMTIHAILTWRAIFMSIAEIMLILMRGLAGDTIQEISLKFPTDQFYTLVCSCKDTFASIIGLGMSIIQTLTSNTLYGSRMDLVGDAGLSLAGDTEDVGALVGEKTLKTASVGGLFFNMITGSTLIPTLALHRFLICTLNSSLANKDEDDASLSIQFEDIAMDKTWLTCVRVGGIASIVNNIDMGKEVGTIIEAFVSFSLSLLTGLGETILYALQLSFDSTIDLFISLVWSLQDILYTFNMRSCKVPNYALRYVLWCSCNDTAMSIPQDRRAGGMRDGALWCVGTLSVNLIDGTPNAIIYNPYSLDTLSDGVSSITQYIECLSSTTNTDPSSSCEVYKTKYGQKLSWLVNQGVEPIAVWAKCKNNYLQNTWDIAAGAMFTENVDSIQGLAENPFATFMGQSIRDQWIQWAKNEVGEDFLLCMQELSRLNVDYSSCMRQYFDIKWKQTPSAYFLYERQSATATANAIPPDSCHVFSGIANSNTTPDDSMIRTQFKNCMMEQESIITSDSENEKTSTCEMNPIIWSTSQSNKISIAKYHGTVPPWSFSSPSQGNATDDTFFHLQKTTIIQNYYDKAIEKLREAWAKFNATFRDDAQKIDVMLFSADGDFIHNFFDCMYLGPYTRMDLFPCDKDNILDCPYYARDDLGGKTRNFSKCFGPEIMYNDDFPPYTCGSRERRSIIKYFFRHVLNKENIAMNVSEKIHSQITLLFQNYTSLDSLGCYDSMSGKCTLQACSLENGFAPCLDTNFVISSQEVEKFIVDTVFRLMPDYYQKTMQDTSPWTFYSNNSRPQTQDEFPFQWRNDPKKAQIARDLHHFSPGQPIISYDTSEVYSMPSTTPKTSPDLTSQQEKTMSSLWSTCMALLGQPSLTIPVENKTAHDMNEKTFEVPIGIWESLLNLRQGTLDMTKIDDLETMVRSMIDAAMKSHSPFLWHKNKRHAPSPSAFCKRSGFAFHPASGSDFNIHVAPLTINMRDDQGSATVKHTVANPPRSAIIKQRGFYRDTIGEAHLSCICATMYSIDTDYCQIERDTCDTFMSVLNGISTESCSLLLESCNSSTRFLYLRSRASEIYDCLRNISDGRVKCPEFALSDIWGFYPVDCSSEECENTKSWLGIGSMNIEYPATRFINDGRGGIRLPNYRHFNSTYHHQLNFKEQIHKSTDYAIEKCFDVDNLIPESSSKEATINLLVDDFISHLFPIVQVVHESHVMAVCSRFIIEIARIQALQYISDSNIEENILQSMAWKTKCESKLRHLKMCDMLGMFYDIPPPENWRILAEQSCPVTLEDNSEKRGIFLTPWCILIDQSRRKIYDAQLCASKLTGSSSPESNIFLDISFIISDCKPLVPSPFSLLDNNNDEEYGYIPLSMLFYEDRLLHQDYWIEELSFSSASGLNLNQIYENGLASSTPENDHISHILDWWPDDLLDMLPGFHITAPSDVQELAPVLFDSHFAYDSEVNIAHYVHTSLRNESMVFENIGSCGICRSPTIDMPIIESNTNRICTRMSKHSYLDTPTFPVYEQKRPGGSEDSRTTWPIDDEFIERHFFSEYCADKATDIPWTPRLDDPLSSSAGGIPGWSLFTETDTTGVTRYLDTIDQSFPPKIPDPLLHDINEEKIFGHDSTTSRNENNNNWGPCKLCVQWLPAVSCDTVDSLRMCPDFQSSCLKISENTTQGICFPSTTYAASSLNSGEASSLYRYPCFASFHCPDDQVCLADGGCHPLYLHIWNNQDYPVEFSVISDNCAFSNENHPYTQTTTGASPWEQIPDILQAHGFCSLHDWFSYRHSIRTKLCPLEKRTSAANSFNYFTCDPTNTSWPWILERPDGTRPTNKNQRTISEEKLLHLVPHKCDQSFMHLGNPWDKHKRLQICSGFQGQQRPFLQDTFNSYDLNDNGNWNDKSFLDTSNTTTNSYWMRTKDTNDNLHIGVLGFDENENDYPLGFLGANILDSNAMADLIHTNKDGNEFKFFKCVDRLACSLPPFTYNGIPTMRLDPYTFASNYSEISLRLCGAIGYIAPLSFWTNQDLQLKLCILDNPMFPVLNILLSQKENRGCHTILWNVQDTKIKLNIIDSSLEAIRSMQSSAEIAQKNHIHCSTTDWIPERNHRLCVFQARSTRQLTEANTNDHVSQITTSLNSLIIDSPNAIISKIQKENPMKTWIYENINECALDIQIKIQYTQIQLQSKYQSLGTSGIYIALKFSLSEMALGWLHHAWLITLLSSIDVRFSLPSLNYHFYPSSTSNEHFLPFWKDYMVNEYCNNDEDLLSRSVLLNLLCKKKSMQYSFYTATSNFISDLKERIKDRARIDISQDVVIKNENTDIFCYETAKWDCDSIFSNDYGKQKLCQQTMRFAHNTTSCPLWFEDTESNKESKEGISTSYLDPCNFPENFRLEDRVRLPESYYTSLSSKRISTILADIENLMMNSFLAALDQIVLQIDYISQPMGEVLHSNPSIDSVLTTTPVSVLKILPLATKLDTQARASVDLDFGTWFQTVCTDKFQVGADQICKSQEEIPANSPCLYPNSIPNEEFLRYTSFSDGVSANYQGKNVIEITYTNEETQYIDICDRKYFPQDADPTDEICIVQYLGNTTFLDELDSFDTNNKIKCDIAQIMTPPGIEVQAFAFRFSKEEWQDMIDKNTIHTKPCTRQVISDPKVKSCSWKYDFPRIDPKTDAWWYSSPSIGDTSERLGSTSDSTMSYIERGQPMYVTFGDMSTSKWWNSNKLWKDQGCSDFTSVCALKLRLENIPGQTRAQCRNTVPSCSFMIDKTKNTAGFQGYHAFATAKHITASNQLYRCAPCTRVNSRINKPESRGLFGCEMVNSQGEIIKSAASRFSSTSTSKYLSYLENSIDFHNAFQTDEFKTQFSAIQSAQTFSEDVNDFVTSLMVRMTPTTENPIQRESTDKWGLRSTQQTCLSSSDLPDLECPTLSILPRSFNMKSLLQIDQRQWDEAISNPNRPQTMDCQSQTISDNDFNTCNPNTNKRRDKLNDFVEQIYRRHNGVWLPKVFPRQGAAWQANVAHPNVKMFSIFHSSAIRTEREVMTKYVLGPLPCSSNDNIKDRICVQSIIHSNLRFEPLHPWLGGNFNPFEGTRGFDECSLSNSRQQEIHTMGANTETFSKRAICQCECDPKINCEDTAGIYNYTKEFKEKQFPQHDSCIQQSYPKSFVMSENDDSNLCFFVRQKSFSSTTDNAQSSNLCYHHQGILGGISTLHSPEKTLHKISTDDFFSPTGIFTNPQDFMIQSMYSSSGLLHTQTPTTSKSNGIWMGKTLIEETNVDGLELFAFLKMTRDSIHPAHIAFSFDKDKTNKPLVIKAIALLPYFSTNHKFPSYLIDPKRWLQTLPLKWKLDVEIAFDVYPSFIQTFSYMTFKKLIDKTYNPSTYTSNNQGGHWSCPFRVVSFWGNPSTDKFSPHIPNPLLSRILFPGFQGAHPLIKMRSAREKLKSYKTTNGICFYETAINRGIFHQDNSNIEYVRLDDASNPCGLKQMMWHLHEGTWSLSRVMNHFHSRCQDIIDFPGLNATFRSDEVVYEKLHIKESQCGVLHRITPFLMRTKGNATNITKHKAGLTTLSQGGDCHMGRAFKFSYKERSKIAGQSHVLHQKNKYRGILKNINSGPQQFLEVERAAPLTLIQLLLKKRKTFKQQLYSSVSKKPFVLFKGPGNPSTDNIMVDDSTTTLSEISFGMHYSVSLTRMLANDLKHQCKKKQSNTTATCILNNDNLVWRGGHEFIKMYLENPHLLLKDTKPTSSTTTSPSILNLLNVLFRGLPQQQKTTITENKYAKAYARDKILWKTPNWTWSYYVETTSNGSNVTPEREYIGTVNRSLWRRNRFEACKQSHSEYFLNPNKTLPKNAMEFNTMRITLCEPAPTGGLQDFCRKLLQYRQDIALINCQIMGKNDCLYSPGMFYVPYAWSPTNQEFSADTVLQYYREVIEYKFKDQKMETVCPARNTMMNNLIKLSQQTKIQCPAEQIEYLKDTFNSIKSIGKDILYMGYCLVMFALNIVALIFTKTGEAGAAMTEVATMYMQEFFSVAAKIIMPILNAFISLIFGTSSSGKIIQEIFVYLCETYNWIMEHILVKVWCTVILPVLGVIFEIIKVVIGSFSPSIRQNIDTIWSVLNGGRSSFDIAGCIGNLRLTMVCRPPDESRSFNASNFYTHHLATRCWIDSKIKNGYSSSVFGGSSEFSFLSCSVSDTCAKDPIRIDDYREDEQNLIPCASCPEVDLQDTTGKKFGCNTLMKRCTCSVNTRTTSECVTNEECAAMNPADLKTCGISSAIDTVRNAQSNVPCTQCGQLGLQPVCIVDGKGDSGIGICACASIKDTGFFHTCLPEMRGQIMPLVSGTGKCLISPNNEMKELGSVEYNIDFSSTAIGACALGLTNTKFEARCLKVTLPAQNSFFDSAERHFVVITNFILQEKSSIIPQITRISNRRLLTLNNNNNSNNSNVFVIHPSFSDIIFECASSLTTNVLQNGNNNTTAIQQNPRFRNIIKDCIHRLWTNQQMVLLYNVTTEDMIFNSIALSFWLEQTKGKGLISLARDSFTSLLSNILTSNINISSCIFRFFNNNINLTNTFNQTNNGIIIKPKRRRHLLTTTNDNGDATTAATNKNLIPIKLPSQTCFALEKPILEISNAFWDTVRLYHSRSDDNSITLQQENNNNNTNTNLSTTIDEKWWYSFPPISLNDTLLSSTNSVFFQNKGWISTIAYTAVSWTISGGSASGEQIVQAMTSNISYDEAIKNNYFTGSRLVSDISRCNFTTITFGPQPSKPLLPWFVLLFSVTYMISSFCSSSTIMSMLLWLFFFPILLFWTVYNVSPLCWPMIPSKLPKDVTSEISKIIPTSIKVPYYLLHPECLSYKTIYFQNESFSFPTSKNLLNTLTSHPDKNACFKKCVEKPFLMKTWQDPLAWWMCEISTDICKWVAGNVKTLPVCKDFVSSVFYFSEVLKLKDKDNEFVQAHRFCAIFSSHEVVFAAAITLSLLLISPSIVQFITEIFSGAIILVIHASNAENA